MSQKNLGERMCASFFPPYVFSSFFLCPCFPLPLPPFCLLLLKPSLPIYTLITDFFLQFSGSVVSDCLRPHGLQVARLPCPSPNSRSLLKLMSIELVMPSKHLILHHPLLLLPSVFPNIRVFLMSQFFASGGQSIGASVLVLPMNS